LDLNFLTRARNSAVAEKARSNVSVWQVAMTWLNRRLARLSPA